MKNPINGNLSGKVLAVALVGSGLLLSACGGMKTDPTEGYKDLVKNSQPPQGDLKPLIYTSVSAGVFNVDPDSQMFNFIEGKSITYSISPVLKMKGVGYKLVAHNLPAGVSFGPSASKPGAYALSWTPAVGTLVDQERERSYRFQIEMIVVSTPDQDTADLLQKLNKVTEKEMRLVLNDEIPLINAIKINAPVDPVTNRAKIMEGETLKFTVTVSDPGAYDANPTIIWVGDDRSTSQEVKKVAGKKFVFIDDQAKKLSTGQYQFEGFFTPVGITFPEGTDSVPVRFILRAIGGASMKSPAEAVEILITKKPAPPAPEAPKPEAPAPDDSASPAPVASPAEPVAQGDKK